MPLMQTRRRFLTTLSLAGAAGFMHARPALAGDGAPEITSVRIQKSASICNAPRYVAQEFLRAEGFTDIRYVSVPKQSDAVYPAFMRGDFDFITDFAPLCVNAIDQGIAVTVLPVCMLAASNYSPARTSTASPTCGVRPLESTR